MSEEAPIIGKVAVKVIPDTKLFKDELKTQLERMEKGKGWPKVEIKVTPVLEEKGLAAKARAMRERVQKEMGDLKLKVNFDEQDSVRAGIAKLKQALSQLGEKTIPVKLNADALTKQIAKLETRLEKISSIKIRYDDQSQESLQRAIGQIDAELAKLKETEVAVKLNERSLSALRRKLTKQLAKIATVNVKVNLDEKESLRRAIAQVDAELARMKEVEIPVKLNERSLTAFRNKLAKQLAKVDTLDIDVNFQNLSSVERAIARIDGELEKFKEVPLNVKLNERSLQAERAKLQKFIDDANKQAEIDAHLELIINRAREEAVLAQVKSDLDKIEFAPDVDHEKLERTKREIEATLLQINDLQEKIKIGLDPIAKRKVELEIDELHARIARLKVDINPEIDQRRSLIVRIALAALGRSRDVVFSPKLNKLAALTVLKALDRLSGHRLGRLAFTEIAEFLLNLDKAVPMITNVATGIAGVGAASLASAANLLALGQSLASIAGLALALPGALAGVAIGFGISSVALKDFKNQLPDVVSKFKSLKKTILDNFWTAKVKQQFRSAFDTIFPSLQSGIAHVSSSLGNFFGTWAQGFAKVFSANHTMERMFDNLAKSIDIMSKHGDSFANIFAVLGRVGSDFLVTLSTDLGHLADKWSAWLQEAEKTGHLQQIIDNAYQAFKDLLSIIGSVIRIFDGLADAARAAGGTVLGTLSDNLKHIADVVNSPEFQQGLIGTFVAAKQAMDEIWQRSGPAVKKAFKEIGDTAKTALVDAGAAIGELIGGVADAIANPKLQQSLADLFESIRAAAVQLRPAWDSVGQAVGSVISLVSTFLNVISQGAAGTLEKFASGLDHIAEALKPVVTILGGALNDVTKVIAEQFERIGAAFERLTKGNGGKALQTLMEHLTPILQKLGQILGDMIVAAIDWLNKNLPDLVKAFTPLLDSIKDFLDKHGDELVKLIPQVLDGLKGLVIAAAQLATAIAAIVNGPMAPFISFIILLGGDIIWAAGHTLEYLGTAIGKVKDGLSWFFGSGKDDLPNKLGDRIVTSFKITLGGIRDAFEWLWQGMSEGFPVEEKINNFFTVTLPNAFKTAWTWLTDMKQKFDDWWNNLIVNVSISVTQWLQKWDDFWFNIKLKVVKGISDAGKAISGWLGDVVKWFADLPAKILDALGMHDLANLLRDQGKKIIDGFWDGLKASWEKVKAWFGVITNLIPTLKGPESKDKVLLYDAGQLIMNGFLNGLESRYDAVRKSLTGFTDEIGGMVTPATAGIGRSLPAMANGAYAGSATNKVLNYYAAAGGSLSSEEDLFAAANRARMGW